MSLLSIVAAVYTYSYRTVLHLLFFYIAACSIPSRRKSAKAYPAETETAPSSTTEPEETVVYTGEACSHVSQNGISFHFPASQSKCKVELRFKVVNDDYVLPKGYEDMPLVSSMFKITASDELPVPVTVQMAIIEEDDSLVHMIAYGPPPYHFKPLPEGKFPLGECYGEIQMKRFCTLTQAQKRRGLMSLSVHIVYHSYCSATFVATRNLRTLNRVVKKKYADAIKVVEQSISCDHSTEAITLRIPRPKPRGWCVQPEFEPPKIQTRLIREYREGKIPPCIHLSMTWTGEGMPVEEKVKIAVGGTSVESFFLSCRPACASDSSLAALSLSPQRPSAPFSPISCTSDTPRQFQAPTSLHTPFTHHTDTPRQSHVPTSLHTPFTYHTDTPRQSHATTSLHTPFTHHTDTPRQSHVPTSLHTPFTHHTGTPRQSHVPTSLHTPFTYHTDTPRQSHVPTSLHTPFTHHTDTPRQFQAPTSLHTPFTHQFQTPTSLHTPFTYHTGTPHLFQTPTSLHTPFTHHTDTPRQSHVPTSLHTPFTHHTGTPRQSHVPTSLHTPFTYHTDTPRQFQTPTSLHTPFTYHTDTPRQFQTPTSLHTPFTHHTDTPRLFQTPTSLHTPFTYYTDTPRLFQTPTSLHTPFTHHTDTPRLFQTPTSLHTPFTYYTDTPHHSPSPHTLHTDTPLAQHTDTLHTLPSQHADTPHPEPAQHTNSPAQHAADNLGLSAESRALRRSNSVFTRGVDPENLVTVLYSNFLLTPEEKARAMKQTLTVGQKLEEIFQSLERRVSTRPQDFKKIIRALMAEPALKAVGDRMQGEF